MYDDGEVSGDATVLLFHLVRCEQWHGGECHWPLSPHNPVKEALYEGACVLGSRTLSGLTDDDGKTLLFRAMESGKRCCAEFLLEHLGVDVNECDGEGWTVLHHIAANKVGASPEMAEVMCRFLLQRGASVRVRDTVGSTPLHCAAYGGIAPIVSLILHHGADPNCTCSFGWTPLHYAAERGHDGVVKMLLAVGAECREEGDGQSPLDMAANENIHYSIEADLLHRDLSNVEIR